MRLIPVFASALVLAGCASSVALEPASLDDATSKACSQFVGSLPVTLDGARRANTAPKSSTTAAWGPPFITLRCGVTTPTAYTSSAELLTINGVDWLPETLTNGTMFTTIGRTANVEVVVPKEYAPEANAIVEVSQIVNTELPLLPH